MVQLLFNFNKWSVDWAINAHYINEQKLGNFVLVIASVGREMLNSKELKLSNSDQSIYFWFQNLNFWSVIDSGNFPKLECIIGK